MYRTLKLYEELMLLALKDEEGTILVEFIEYAVAGAVLAELLKDQYLQIDGKGKITLFKEDHDLDDMIMNEALSLIKEKSRTKDLKHWTYKIAGIKDLKHRVALQLCEKNILKADTDKILFIFTRKIYPEINADPERHIITRLDQAIFSQLDEIDEKTMILIALADSVDLLRKIFGAKKIKPYKHRIKTIINGELTSKAAKEVIEACQAAVMVAAIMPAIIASTVSS